jgi:hypothetical protein
MTNVSRRYYERELGAGLGPSPSMKEHFGYSEPLRRFIQRESFEPQANEIPNTMPSWLPGDDYMTNFKVGDPYVRVDDGYARLPGAGYEALHPELEGLNPEEYPDIHKLRILSVVAPYPREYNQVPSSCLTQKTSRARATSRSLALPQHSSAQASARNDCHVPACVRFVLPVTAQASACAFSAHGVLPALNRSAVSLFVCVCELGGSLSGIEIDLMEDFLCLLPACHPLPGTAEGGASHFGNSACSTDFQASSSCSGICIKRVGERISPTYPWRF